MSDRTSAYAAATYLSRDFEALGSVDHAHARGRSFEQIGRQFFLLYGFDVVRNSTIAAPRETDLCAVRRGQYYVIEFKWQRDAVDIDALDSLSARLDRAPRGSIGCFFSMSPYSNSARRRVAELKRAELGGREILLFDATETEAVFCGVLNLEAAIARKLRALRESGVADFLDLNAEEHLLPLDLPPARIQVVRGSVLPRSSPDTHRGPRVRVRVR